MCTTLAWVRLRVASATGAASAAATLPCACEIAPTLKLSPVNCASRSRIFSCGIWYLVPSVPIVASARGPICPRGTPAGNVAGSTAPQPAHTPL